MSEKTFSYEERYNEALERASVYHNELHNCRAKDELESIFPELRESEDERIRKELIGYHKHMAEMFVNDESCRHPAWIAWLEKQKETLHISESCKENAEHFTSQCGDNRFELIDKAKRDIIAKTNIESSPDEMNVLDSFLFRAWQMGWLGKYDVIVPEQMPADWTDKDKRILDDISKLLITFNYKEMARDYKQAIEKLIYKPHWKPSEEQMQAIKYVVSSIPPNYLKEQKYTMGLVWEVISNLEKL